MSTLEVNTINPQSGTTVTIGGSGDTVTLGSGATQSGFGGVNTPSFHAYRSADWSSVPNSTWAKIPINTEEWDTDSAYDTSTYRFTPQVAGKYYIYASCNNGTSLTAHYVAIYKNGGESALTQDNGSVGSIPNVTRIVELNGSTDYVEAYAFFQGTASASMHQFRTFFGGFKIIE
jgi:hypothetical protein